MNITIIDAMSDKELFGRWFKPKWLKGDTWAMWRIFLRALYALPLTDKEREIYTRHTGRTDLASEPYREAAVPVGRRGGKSLISALIACFMAAFQDYSTILAPGETGVVMIIAADRRQARVVLGYIAAFFEQIPMLASLVKTRLKESIELTNGIRLEVHTSSFRAVRGYTVVCAICDEVAFWMGEDSANPDVEILNSLRPAMSTVPNGLLLLMSSPYSRRGALYESHRDHFGKENAPVLVWQAPTEAMNPTVSSLLIKAAYLRDSAVASAEYGALFRTDVEGLFSEELVRSAVLSGCHELPPIAEVMR